MTEIRFYHLTRRTLEQALPELLEKSLERGWRTVVMAGSKERVETLNQGLWTYRDDSFLPHGALKDGHAADQPIWLTESDENPNGASVLMLTDGAASQRVGDYQLVCVIFDGNDSEAVARSRSHWKDWQTAGHTLTYWQQTERGWTQKGI